MRRVRAGAAAAALLLAAAGCAKSKAFVRPGLLDAPPRRVAVLPFVITYAYDVPKGEGVPETHRMGREILRKTFYYGLTPYGYQDVKLDAVDRALEAGWGDLDAGVWREAGPQALGSAIGADALVYGDVGRIMHFTTPLYTETSLEAVLRMVDARTGEELWRKKVKAYERGGAVMKKGQVVELVKDQVRSWSPEVKFLRIADDAVRQALSDFPNPAMPAEETAAAAEPAGPGLRLAILPLDPMGKRGAEKAAWLRAQLAANLQAGPFGVIELQQVDAALRKLGWTEGQPLPGNVPPDELAQALGADAVLRGSVTSWGRSYWVVQSWVTAGLALELVDGRSGDVVWSASRKNRRHAGLLKGPTGYKSAVTAPIMGLKGSHLERVGAHLARSMAQELLGAPSVQAYVSERQATEPVQVGKADGR